MGSRMFNVTVTEDGRLLDELQFDEVNVLHHDGGVAMIHRDVILHRHRSRDGLRIYGESEFFP